MKKWIIDWFKNFLFSASAPLYRHFGSYSWFSDITDYFEEDAEIYLGCFVLLFIFLGSIGLKLFTFFIKEKFFNKNSSKNTAYVPLFDWKTPFFPNFKKFIILLKKIKFFFKHK
jgi:hypothetical protein